jgi:hypothetical protein
MNIEGGSLEFEALLNNEQLIGAISEAERRVKGFSSATVAESEKIDDAFEVTAENIKIQKDVIDQLEKEVVNLEQQIDKIGPGEGQAKIIEQAKSAKQELEAEKEALKVLESQVTRTYDTFDVTNENIRIQKEVIAELENQVKNLDAEIGKLAPGKAQSEMRQQAAEVKAELAAETEALKILESQVQTAEKAHVSFRTRIRELKETIIEMEAAGKRNTIEYENARNELATLTDAMADATAQANILAHDQKGMQGIISGLTGITGAFSAAQGAIGLFAGENENLQKIMLKVQSLMAITIGLQQVEQMLNKDSPFILVTVAKAKTMLATATSGLAAALGVSTVAAQALLATLTLGLSAAITAIIVLVSKYVSKSKEAQKATEEFNKAVVDCAYKPIAAVEELSIAWSKLGDNLKDKEKFIIDHAEDFKNLGSKIRDVKDAENLLINNKEKFISSLVMKAKAMASAEIAASKYKEALLKQLELEKTPEKVARTRNKMVQGSPGKGSYGMTTETYYVDNEDYAKLKEAKEKLEKEGLDLFKKSAEFTAKEKAILKEIGVSTNNIVEGSIAALEQSISRLKEKYRDAANDTDRKALLKQIKTQESLLNKMDQTSNKKEKDPYKESLEKRKKLYQQYLKWVNSNDPGVKKAAESEFASLLKEGKTYLDYLKKQRDQLMSIDTRTADQNKKLKTLNDQIAEESKKTVLQSFDEALKKQMNSATSIVQMLDIIAQKRKELSGDGSDLDNAQKDILDKAEEDTNKQAQEETTEMLRSYTEYLDRKLSAEVKYQDQMTLLRRRATETQNAEEKKQIESAMSLLSKMHEAGIRSFDELEDLNKEAINTLGSFEGRRLEITTYYNKLIAAERIKGNETAAKQLEGQRDMEILQETKQYKDFFGKIQTLSINTFEATRKALLKMMQEAYNSGKLTYDQYKDLIDKINKQADSAYQGRGMESIFGNSKGGGFMNMIFGEGDFQTKLDSFKTIFSGAKGDMADIAGTSGEVAGNAGEAQGAMEGAAGGAAGALSMVDAIITAVYQTLQAVSGTLRTIADYQDSIGHSDASDNLQDWADCIDAVNETAMSGWENLKSGNVMGAIQDTISMPFKLLTTLNRIHDKHIDKSINKHGDAVKDLTNAYNQLSWAIDKALGGEVYKNQKAAIHNMEAQREHLLEMKRLEEDKKKTDGDKVRQYQEQYDQLGRDIEDMLKSISEDILQTNAKDFADQLGDAIVEAFGKGEDAATAFGETADSIMKQAVLNQLKKNFLEKQLQGALDGLEKSMGYWNGDTFVFDGLTPEEQARFKNQISSIGKNFTQALGVYEDLFKDLKDEISEPDTTLQGGIQSVSEETASIVAGQMNAMRINQMESINILRQQLIVLNRVALNTSYNVHLAKLTQIVDLLKGDRQSDSLRAMGLS